MLTFTLPDRHARGRMVRLGPTLDLILSAHDYAPPIRDLLAEALVITALIGSLLKEDGSQLTMQAQTEGGVVDLLACDYRGGELRGYIRHDTNRLAILGPRPSLFALLGRGYLGVTFNVGPSGQRYQGIVPLERRSLTETVQSYFVQSEQVPTLMRVGLGGGPGGWIAGGLLVQHLAEGEEGRARLHVRLDHPEWEHVTALAGTTSAEELTDPALPLETIVWRLFHEEREIRVLPGRALSRGCRCTAEHYAAVLSQFGDDDRSEMRDSTGMIPVDCAFCAKVFRIVA